MFSGPQSAQSTAPYLPESFRCNETFEEDELPRQDSFDISEPELVLPPWKKNLHTIDLQKYASAAAASSFSLDFAVGELKGNPSLLLYLLGQRGVISFNDKVYQAFRNIQLELEGIPGYPEPAVMSRIISDCEPILHREIGINPLIENFRMILLGGELLTGRPVDFLMLYMFQWLDDCDMPFEILLSEKSWEYMIVSEAFRQKEEVLVPPSPDIFSWAKLYNKYYSFQRSLKGRLYRFYDVFKDHVKLISYRESDVGLVMFFHRFVSFSNVENSVTQLAAEVLASSTIKTISLVDLEWLQKLQGVNWKQSGKDISDKVNTLFSHFLRMDKIRDFLKEPSFFRALENPTQMDRENERYMLPFVVHSLFEESGRVLFCGNNLGLESQVACLDASIDVADLLLKRPSSVFEVETRPVNTSNISKNFFNISVDLLVYPKQFQNKPKKFVLGDLHGNPLVLLQALIIKRIITMSPSTYNDLVYYIRSFGQMQPSFLSADSTYFEKIEADLDNSLSRISLCEGFCEIEMCLIGDEIADRGPNDYVMLKVLSWLSQCGLPFSIIFSNHGFEHIRHAETDYSDNLIMSDGRNCYFLNDILSKECAISLDNFLKLIRAKSSFKEKALKMYQEVYQKHLRLISYHIEENEMTLMVHACVGLKTIEEIASYLNSITASTKKLPPLQFSKETKEALKASIDALNERFLQIFQRVICDMTNGSKDFSHPLIRLMWERHEIGLAVRKEATCAFDGMFEEYIRTGKSSLPYKLNIAHGHSGAGFVYPDLLLCTANLDSTLGKGPDFNNEMLSSLDW